MQRSPCCLCPTPIPTLPRHPAACRQDGKPSGGLLGMLANAQATLLGRFSRMADEQAEPASSSARGRAGLPEPPLMPGGDNALPWLAGAAAVAAVVLAAALGLRRSGSGQWRLWEQLPPPPPEAAEAAAAIGLPAHALRPHYSSEQPPAARRAQQQRREQQASMKAAAAVQEQQRLVPVISKSAATRLVQQWLVSWCLHARCIARLPRAPLDIMCSCSPGAPPCLPCLCLRRASRRRPWGRGTPWRGCPR